VIKFGLTDFRAKAKYDSWAKLRGMSQKKAMEDYIMLVEKLQG
jgi:diazepam-binding inhibitor (GABA receptor modulator, acyl-CoA-binding protein)